ncbi:hypothetical protein E1H12_09485 [Geitlerinema sp. P-1104]|nr:hypothetical protein [Geitlerinema sp. P-1104]
MGNFQVIFDNQDIHRGGTGNGEQGTGNREQGTGNGEEGTGNRERGTGNGEQGTEGQLAIGNRWGILCQFRVSIRQSLIAIGGRVGLLELGGLSVGLTQL